MKNLLVLILLLSMLISCNKSDDIKEIDIPVNKISRRIQMAYIYL